MSQDQRGGLRGACCSGCLPHTNQHIFTNFTKSGFFAEFEFPGQLQSLNLKIRQSRLNLKTIA